MRKHSHLVDAKLRASKSANALFLDILRSQRNVATSLNQMHETGVLGRFVPDFGRITGHGQFDRYHCYTVDAHTIRAIDILRDFRLGGRAIHRYAVDLEDDARVATTRIAVCGTSLP